MSLKNRNISTNREPQWSSDEIKLFFQGKKNDNKYIL